MPFDTPGAHKEYHDLLACACNACEAQCHYTKPLTCSSFTDAGSDGAGGGGAGAGGAGGHP